MESADLIPLLERLEDNVDDLEEVLQPLLERQLTDTSRKLPVLDRAKLHVLITYTLESILFSYLRLHGINAKEHPVFRELTRVKQYFEKIKVLETEPEQRTMTLDKAAAGRFIKHGLAGNDKYDLERAEREAKEKALAQLRAKMLAKKSAATSQKPSAEEDDSSSSSDSDSDSDNGGLQEDEIKLEPDEPAQPKKPTKEAIAEKRKAMAEKRGQAKGSKSKRRQDKEERREAQRESRKERRRKKNEARKARKAGVDKG